MTFPVTNLPTLPPNTIVPEDKNLFISYLNRLYEDIAFSVNNKDTVYFPISITNTATNITNLPTFGSYTVCVSGSTSGMPCTVAALCKSSSIASGTVAILTSQVGTSAPWIGASITISSTASNYQINHSVAVTAGNFNIRIVGTQGPI